MRYLQDQEEAKDVLQDGFIIVFEKIHTFENKGSFEGWLRKIFVNQAITRLRQLKKKAFTYSIDESFAVVDDGADFLNDIEAAELMKKIEMLPDYYRVVLSMYAIDNYSFKEIGELLSISTQAIRSTYFRARNRFLLLIKND